MIADDFDIDCKDVYEPEGFPRQLLEIETAFHRSGYSIRRSELSPHRTPIMILHLRRETAPEFDTDAQFVEHTYKIIAEVCRHVRKRDLTIQQTIDRILVAFPLQQPPQAKPQKRIGLRNLLNRLP